MIRRMFHQDPAHRLQVISTMKQYSTTAASLKVQVIKIKADVNQINAQITSILNSNPTLLNPLTQIYTSINNQIDSVIGSIHENMDVSDLKILVESKIISIGWT